MHPLSDSPTSAVPRLIRDVFAADSDLANFFERISVADLAQFEEPLSTPSLLVYPGDPEMKRQVGGEIVLLYKVRAMIILPRSTPALPGLTVPSAPTTVAGATGPLTGTYEYRLSQYGASSESYASDSGTSVTVTAKKVSVTIPALTTGGIGYRVWRSKAGKTACRWVGTVIGGGVTYTDDTPDAQLGDELAPVLLMPERLSDAVVRTILTGEWLTESGVYKSDGSVQVTIGGDQLVTSRNVRMREVIVSMPSYYNAETNTFLIGGVV